MYDLAVIGAGPAGLEAIHVALKNNLKVIVFEKEELGGTCLNVGCVPTKTILHSACLLNEIKNASKIGINLFSEPNFSWQTVLDRKMEIVNKFTKLLNSTLSKNLTLVKDEAELFIDGDDIQIFAQDNIYEAKNIIVATGSKPLELKGLEFDHKFIINSDDIYNLVELPKRMTIVGSGAIGLEWAMILSGFGVNITLIEKAQALAPNLDIDLQKRAERALKVNNIQYFKNDYIVNLNNDLITLNSGVSFETDCILVAVGRKPVLPKVTINGCIEQFILKADEFGKTELDNVFLVGDAKNDVMLAHSAANQARQIMNHILHNKEMTKKLVPSVIYITPEMAGVGLREQDIQQDESYIIKKMMITSLAKSWCDNAMDGIIKVILKDDLIVGAHVVSKEASALISILNIMIDRKIPICEIEDMIFPHPSYAEAIQEVLKNG